MGHMQERDEALNASGKGDLAEQLAEKDKAVQELQAEGVAP